jgi:hypothetical protein
MRDAVICEPLRTPVGRYGGALKDGASACRVTTSAYASAYACGRRPGYGPGRWPASARR